MSVIELGRLEAREAAPVATPVVSALQLHILLWQRELMRQAHA